VLVLTAAIHLEGAPFLELRSGPMTSALGTKRTCWADLRMSVYEGEAEVGGTQSDRGD
jgi:hypothetical protein